MTNWIISSSVLILGVILLRFVLKGKISLRLQYGLWALVMLRLLIPFSIGETVISVGNWFEQMADTKEMQAFAEFTETKLPSMSYDAAYEAVADIYAEKGIDIAGIPEERFSETIDYEIMEKMTRDGKTLAEMAEFVWIIGAGIVASVFLASNLHFSMKLKSRRIVLADELENLETMNWKKAGIDKLQLDNARKKENTLDALSVYVSDEVETPCMYGLFSPAIYVTREVLEDENALRHVIEHEKTHYLHKDHIWSVLRVLCLIIHWYNPLVWWAAALSREDAELACDEATILRLGEKERAAYGRTLIGLTCEKHPAMLLTATTMTGSRRSIRERISLIAKKPKMAVLTLVLVLFISVIAVGCTFTGPKDTENDVLETESEEETTDSQTSENEDMIETPITEIDNIFNLTAEARISLHTKENRELNAYIIPANQYPHKRLIAIFNSFEWKQVTNPNLSTSEFWISLQTTDGSERVTFWDVNHGIVECCKVGGEPVFWELSVKQPDDAEIFLIPFFESVRHVFDNLEVEMLSMTFEETGDASQAAHTFAYEIYGNHYMNLSPGNSYGFDEYEVVKLEIDEISEDGTQVEVWLTYAFVPWDMNSSSIWAGNTDYATGEYEGKLWANNRFTLLKQEDGVWRCIGIGTSAETE